MSGEDVDSQLTLGKLYLKFKNLDFRLNRVEEVILKREESGSNKPVKKRVTTFSRSGYHSIDPGIFEQSNDLNHHPSSSLLDVTSINPILTSGTDILSLVSYKNNSAYSLPLSGQSSVSIRALRKDDIKVIYIYI